MDHTMRKLSDKFAAAAPRGLGWLSLFATSASIAYALTTALGPGGSNTLEVGSPIQLERTAARNPTTEAPVIATLRQWLALRGLDSDLVNASMVALPPGHVTAADFVDENGIDTSIGSIQSEAWLVSTAAGRWWVWEYVSAPANGRALMHDSHSYGP
jgi:hypothetical protein